MITDFKEVEKTLRSKGYYYDRHSGQRVKVELGRGCSGYARIYSEETGWFLTPVFNVPQSINPLFISKDGEVVLSSYSVGGTLSKGYESIDEYNGVHHPDNTNLATVQQIHSVELYNIIGLNKTAIEFHFAKVPAL